MYSLEPATTSDYYPKLTLDASTVAAAPIGYTIYILLYMQCGGGYTTLTMTNPRGNTASICIPNTFNDEWLRVVRIVRCLNGWAVM